MIYSSICRITRIEYHDRFIQHTKGLRKQPWRKYCKVQYLTWVVITIPISYYKRYILYRRTYKRSDIFTLTIKGTQEDIRYVVLLSPPWFFNRKNIENRRVPLEWRTFQSFSTTANCLLMGKEKMAKFLLLCWQSRM